ncbi:hypothetical protein CSQ85_08950 [Bifidobacterium rousetti]|uniref:DNA-processing protein DprA n=1 Tax=Bifidobacterium rousetti TaxID=2045439 RepID=UPI00123B8B50|nr:DNA-processing protein DprA [Bifidobacterium rousetti]KAA8818278.1 hypothetical protein CSQ85_08950 [Bifidobacterium rousetti]
MTGIPINARAIGAGFPILGTDPSRRLAQACDGMPTPGMVGDLRLVEDGRRIMTIEGDPRSANPGDLSFAARLVDEARYTGWTLMAGMGRGVGFKTLRDCAARHMPMIGVDADPRIAYADDTHRMGLARLIADQGLLITLPDAPAGNGMAMRVRMRLADWIVIVNTPVDGPIVDEARQAAGRGAVVWACPSTPGSWTHGREGCDLLIQEGAARPAHDPKLLFRRTNGLPGEPVTAGELDRLLDRHKVTDPEERRFHHAILARTGRVMGFLTR